MDNTPRTAICQLGLDHYNKYKVFDVFKSEDPKVAFRISGCGDELPYEQLRRMRVGQGQIVGKNRLLYERVL